MLTASYVGLRFLHFSALMLVFGCSYFISLLAPFHLQRLMARYFMTFQRGCLLVTVVSAFMLYALQGGLMGNGWQDVWQPHTWLLLVETQFGSVWVWQMVMAVLTFCMVIIQPFNQCRLMLVCGAQLLLMAGVGHAAMLEGLPGLMQRTNHALHLICASLWFGGLLPVIFCMNLTRRRWQKQATLAMMRFSRYGHVAVAGVLITGTINGLFIQGMSGPWHTAWGRLLLIKSAFVVLMVAIALVNRYVLVPRLSLKHSRARQTLILMTWTEVVLGAFALAAVSLFATWEPF